MREDQFERLQALTEKLTDVFLDEADPEKWPGHGLENGEMEQQTRGDRYWCKKNAAATLTVIMKTTNLIATGRPPTSGDSTEGGQDQPDEADGLDGEIRAAEKEAIKLLNKLNSTAGKAAFDKRVHGKP